MVVEDLFTPLSASFALQEKGTPWWRGKKFTSYKEKWGKKRIFVREYETKRGTFTRVKIEVI